VTDHACERCGDDVAAKNAAGHYRDHCVECLQAIAEARTPHREACDDPDCVVCASWRAEQRGDL
jgi:hypothetical protein